VRRLIALVALAGCAGQKEEPRPEPSPSTPATTTTAAATPPDAAVAPPDAAPPPAVEDGADFTAEAKLLFRVAACGNDDPLPPYIPADVVARHCKLIREQMDEYRARYVEGGRAFFARLVPPDAPKTVVYPFGGGDLISALVAFPDAEEITTISLELAGDPRRIATPTIDRARLEASLAALRIEIGGTLQVGSNTSENLSQSQDNDLPAQVSSFLMGLAATGFEPVSMRYFRVEDDGSIHYITAEEVAAGDAAQHKALAKKRKGRWVSPNFAEAFAHVEIRYRKVGDDHVRIHHHLGWNLGDEWLTEHPQLLRHLEAKGKVTMMTKGASYLLWQPGFSKIRNYMLANLAWMLSDSTGIPPAFARKAGMVQETYGTFVDAFLPHAQGTKAAQDFAALWQRNPHRRLPFRFGYVDRDKNPHLVVTHPGS